MIVEPRRGEATLVFPRPKIVLTLACLCLFTVRGAFAGDGPVDFSRQIRPLLSDRCYRCHGFDPNSRVTELRLDVRDEAVQDRGGWAAIVPGDPQASELFRRITAAEDERMPPADSNKHLTEEEIDLIRRWIAQGASYEPHWAFRPIQRPNVPSVRDRQWGNNSIDRFILSRLEQQSLKPSPEGDRATLIRRLYQDLLGLLPSPAEVDEFLHDPAENAYERLVDRLLASPHYGERWGRHWLDQARYADSHGYTIDGAREMWPYRDWVIWALNQDMPFDQFTIEQLAGDLLPSPSKNQLIATAFHRNTMINQEGGVKADQYRHEAVVDRVNTTGAVWLGLTVGCAQCHTHKFDPLSHEEYYRLYAFFNQCQDANNAGPTVSVAEGEVFGWSKEQTQANEELARLRAELARLKQQQAAAAKASIEVPKSWHLAAPKDYRTASNASFKLLKDGSLLSDGNAAENDTYYITVRSPLKKVTAVRLRVLTHDSLPKMGPGTASNGNFVLTDFTLQIGGKTVRFADAWADHEQPEYGVAGAIDSDRKSGWAINVGPRKEGQPQQKMNAPHEAVFFLRKPIEVKDELTVVMKHGLNENYLVGRFAIDVTEEKVRPRTTPASDRIVKVEKLIAKLQSSLPGSGKQVPQMVMADLEKTVPTYRLDRGDFLEPDTQAGELQPGVPAALSLSERTFHNRLDLAEWLVSDSNPLTARVIVNRIWMRYFGRGIVETENDFGYQGTAPTHPELLDWLASEFSRHWSLKQLHRLIVTSATYRQQSDYRADLEEADPYNYLLGRQTRLRVEAEVVRDMALSASGLLARQLGGPSVFPPQPQGVYSFTQTPKPWPESQGADRYRRTMYTMFYRSAPYPLLSTFDAPDFSNTCTSRVRSNTPLQALTLANDEVFVELAAGLAVRACEMSLPTLPDKIRWMFRACLSREPESEELAVLVDFAEREQQRFAKGGAEKMLGKVRSDSAPDNVLAALTSVARALFNTDEFVTRN